MQANPLDTHDADTIVLRGTPPFERSEWPVPGDLVQHIDDHEALGTVVARAGVEVAVVWTHAPELSHADVVRRKVQHYVMTQAKGVIGSPLDKRTQEYVRHATQVGLETMRRQDIISNFTVNVQPSPVRHQLDIQVTYSTPFPMNSVTLMVTLGP